MDLQMIPFVGVVNQFKPLMIGSIILGPRFSLGFMEYVKSHDHFYVNLWNLKK